MLVAAALCPGPPLLVPGLSGADPAAAQLRAATAAAVAALLAAGPELVAIVGAAARTAQWPADARPDLSAYGGFDPAPTGPVAPLSIGLGALLLDWAGYDGDRLMWTVDGGGPSAPDIVPADIVPVDIVPVDIVPAIVQAAPRVGLLVVADGSARRTTKAPGYIDERAGRYDADVLRAVSTGDLKRLSTLDPRLARELMAPGWPALQVLAAAAGDIRAETTVHYCDAPYGVGYLVASMRLPAGTAA